MKHNNAIALKLIEFEADPLCRCYFTTEVLLNCNDVAVSLTHVKVVTAIRPQLTLLETHPRHNRDS